ncbi:MAG: hypothetical protein ACOYL2_13130, partial [Burkholderiaceae bacterium]
EFIGFNLLNTQSSAIDYAVGSYTGKDSSGNNTVTNSEAGGPYRVFHPIESRTFRVMLITRY